MISKNTRVFEIDNIKYRFNFQAFNKLFKNVKDKEKITIGELENQLSEEIGVSKEAVHNWRSGSNGPADIILIKDIARRLRISDWKYLLIKIDGDKIMQKYTDKQLESIKRIYDSIIEFLNDFNNTDGFTGGLWYEYERNGIRNIEEEIGIYADNQISKVHTIVDKEYFYLHGLEIYDKLIDYSYNDLYNTYDGKLGYAYRFEAIPDGNPTTQDDYEKALQKINEIIDECNN